MTDNDCTMELIRYLNRPSSTIDLKLKQKALKYVLLYDKLYKRRAEGLLLKCLDKLEAMKVMGEVHEGVYRSHRLGPKWDGWL